MGILHIGHEVVAYLLSHFPGISLDLKKKLFATLARAFLLDSVTPKRRNLHTNKFFLPFPSLFFSFFF